MLKSIEYTISGASPAQLWRGFRAGCHALAAPELPQLLRPEALDGAGPGEIIPQAMAELGRAAGARPVREDEPVLAGFEIAVNPCSLTTTFGSGRSGITLVLSRYGESRIDVGLQFSERELADPEGAKESALARYEAAYAAV